MNFLRLMMSVLAVVTMGTSLIACSSNGDSQSRVDSANTDVDRINAIQAELKTRQYFVWMPELSRPAIQSASLGELNQVEALLNEYIARSQNVLEVLKRSDVRLDGNDGDRNRQGMIRRAEGARELKRMVEAQLGLGGPHHRDDGPPGRGPRPAKHRRLR